MERKLYRLAIWYIGKCNAKWGKSGRNINPIGRLTYWAWNKYLLLFGADAEWQNFKRYDILDNAIQKLADYEVLEEQGLLIKLPCKEGTPIWVVDYRRYDKSTVYQAIFRIEFLKSYNKGWFLTREEAEKALAEMQKG